jgi:hypothetical protein
MDNNFKLGTGIEVNLGGIREAYSITKYDKGHRFTVNVSADNIEKIFMGIVSLLKEPLFLVLEIPANSQDEKKLRVSDNTPFHKDIFYLDGINYETFSNIYAEYQVLLENDGYISFGIGSHNGEEVFVGRYKIFSIFVKETQRYVNLLNESGFLEVKELKTVRENITPEIPAKRKRVTVGELDIYKMVERLKELGLYFAECCED